MSLSILDRGESRFDLMRGDEEIGWVAGRAVGFTGFGDRHATLRAASIAYDALSTWLARQRRIDAPPRATHRLRIRRAESTQSADELLLGDIAIGRLLYQPVKSGLDGAYAFELLLPPRIGAPLSAAQVMFLALERHRAVRDATTVGDVA